MSDNLIFSWRLKSNTVSSKTGSLKSSTATATRQFATENEVHESVVVGTMMATLDLSSILERGPNTLVKPYITNANRMCMCFA